MKFYSDRKKANTRKQITRCLQHISELAQIARRSEAKQHKLVKQAEGWAESNGHDDIETTLRLRDSAVKPGTDKLDLDQFSHPTEAAKVLPSQITPLIWAEINCMQLFQVNF